MMRPFRLTRTQAFLLAWISLGWVTGPVAFQTSTASTSGSLQQSIDKLLLDPSLRGAFVGVLALRADNNETLYEKNADLRFVPASNVKIVTSATALLAMGK
ncbi:MAG: D-alanyl-D-alanine carboxypeptidase, partial [Armatimonadetes bacterium]|nr:D-alanyl-D-alanine carboxypeptidase [Armatimonadota bacterium]